MEILIRIQVEIRNFLEILGNPSNYFLGIPLAKRTSVLPARVFDIAAGHRWGAGCSQLARAPSLRALVRERADRPCPVKVLKRPRENSPMFSPMRKSAFCPILEKRSCGFLNTFQAFSSTCGKSASLGGSRYSSPGIPRTSYDFFDL